MNKFFIWTVILTICPLLLIAQAPDTVWTKTYGGTGGEQAMSVQQTLDSGYIIVGWTNSFGAGSDDIYLIKTDEFGNLHWEKTYGGPMFEEGLSVQQTADTGYIVVGGTGSYGAGYIDVYLVKTDVNGDTLWTKTYGGTDADCGFYVQQTSDNGYIISGCTYSYGAGNIDIYLIRTDANGDTLWTRTYGGTDYDYGASVRETSDNGYIVGGFTGSYGAGNHDFYLIKTDANGDTLWTKTYGGTGADIAYSMEQTSDNGYIIVGSTNSFGAGNYDFYLVRTDVNGDTLWTQTYGDYRYDVGFSVHETADSGYIIVGGTESFGAGQSDVYLIKTDANGDTLWTQTYGGIEPDCGRFVRQTMDNGYIIAGYTFSFGPGGFDVWLIKTESDMSIKENESSTMYHKGISATIFSGLLQIPEGKTCRLFNITGRVVILQQIKPGVYFIEVDGKITQKVVKVR